MAKPCEPWATRFLRPAPNRPKRRHLAPPMPQLRSRPLRKQNLRSQLTLLQQRKRSKLDLPGSKSRQRSKRALPWLRKRLSKHNAHLRRHRRLLMLTSCVIRSLMAPNFQRIGWFTRCGFCATQGLLSGPPAAVSSILEVTIC